MKFEVVTEGSAISNAPTIGQGKETGVESTRTYATAKSCGPAEVAVHL